MLSKINTISIIGLGLIGGSIALAIKKNLPNVKISAFDHNQTILNQALSSNVIDEGFSDYKKIAASDLIIIATPLSVNLEIISSITPYLNQSSLVIDVGSVKQSVINDFKSIKQQFIPCHPIAGKESSGFDHAEADLFVNRSTIIISDIPASKQHIEYIEKFWISLGAHIKFMKALEHDQCFAYVSHLPQAIAFCRNIENLNHLTNLKSKPLPWMRLCYSPISLWCDIFLANRRCLIASLKEFISSLSTLSKDDILSAAQLRVSIKNVIDIHPPHEQPDDLSMVIAATLVKTADKWLGDAGAGFKDMTSPLIAYSASHTTISSEKTRHLEQNIQEFILQLKTNNRDKLYNFLALSA